MSFQIYAIQYTGHNKSYSTIYTFGGIASALWMLSSHATWCQNIRTVISPAYSGGSQIAQQYHIGWCFGRFICVIDTYTNLSLRNSMCIGHDIGRHIYSRLAIYRGFIQNYIDSKSGKTYQDIKCWSQNRHTIIALMGKLWECPL